ncbi:hypothetical protein MKX03_024358 [Papaver bracteatum]|nr:hypothetical protein MKX03_024358 [Papaver bracteatum]
MTWICFVELHYDLLVVSIMSSTCLYKKSYRYGEEGLKGQEPPPGARASGGGASFFSSGDGPIFFGNYSPFGGGNPFGGMGGGAAGARETQLFASMFFDDMFGSQLREGLMNQAVPRKAPPIENTLPCSLEDLYRGTSKKMKISREIADASGNTVPVEEILTIDIKPGWKKGTKITFPEKGNEKPNIIPADLVFIIDEKPHCTFTREGNDLIITQRISLVEALAGTLTIPITNVIQPTHKETVPREGMSLSKDPSRKGNLRIKFNIKFPTRLTAEQKDGIKRLLLFSLIKQDTKP